MVDSVDPAARVVPAYPGTPVKGREEIAGVTDPGTVDPATGTPAAGTNGAVPRQSPPAERVRQFKTEIVRRESPTGELGINVVRVLNPVTGEPIYQSPPEGVLVMLESALWRLRKKDAS